MTPTILWPQGPTTFSMTNLEPHDGHIQWLHRLKISSKEDEVDQPLNKTTTKQTNKQKLLSSTHETWKRLRQLQVALLKH